MIRAEHDVHVSASPEEAFDRLADMRNEIDWNPMTTEMAKASEGEVGSGTRFEGKMKRVGSMYMVISDYDRPRRLGMRGGSRGADVHFTANFEPADGGTRIHTELGLEPKGIVKLFTPLMARQVPKQEVESMEAFKRWIDRGVSG
ncbi:MAG TPA: SRPBCC family protein [Gaiellaceae bacterium]|jgi:hypothetical protein